MSSHTLTSLLLDTANDANNSTELSSNVTSVVSNFTTTLALTTPSIIAKTTTIASSTAAPLTTTIPLPEDGSHFIFFFCTILFFVGIALVAKIVYSNRKKYRMTPSWRLSASRSSGNVPAGFALTRDPFGSAHYSAVPPSTSTRLASQQQDAFVGNSSAQIEWERQFFEDDASTNESRLEFRR